MSKRPTTPGRRRRSLRARVTVVAGLAITAAVVLGVLFMYLLQMQSVRTTIDGQLRTYATEIEQAAVNGSWAPTLPPSILDADAEAQVLAADGTVLAATRTLVGLPAIYRLSPASDRPVRLKAADGVVPTEIQLFATRTTVDGKSVSIITGTSTDLLRQVNSAFLRHLLLGLPIILLLAAAVVWLVVGRALRPVEKIRRAAGQITLADLSQRVPEPGTRDEIGHLAQTMNAMLQRLEDSAHRQRRFVADASHELRSPLAGIRTTLEVGLAHPDHAPWPVIAQRAADQSVRLEKLLQELLLLAKADEKAMSTQRKPIALQPLLLELIQEMSAGTVRIDLTITGHPQAVGDRQDLSRLFRNVLDNAVRHANNQVNVCGTAIGAHIVIEITDDGPGIPEGERERIFDRFVRLDSSRVRTTGNSGLGLAIARAIATAHHGDISALEAPDAGARFLIRLPAAPRTSTA